MTNLSKKILTLHARRAAKNYDVNAVVEREIADRLLSRLDLMKINPQYILDCGARTGYTTTKLRERYKKSLVVGCDLSEEFLLQTKMRFLKRRAPRVCADYSALPFGRRKFDLIFSNLALSLVNDLSSVMREFFRLLKPNGLLLFTTLGPDTLKELRSSFITQNQVVSVHSFTDMHEIGDSLMKHKFLDPVMDMEYLHLHYDSVERLLRDLKSVGASNAQLGERSIYGKAALHAVWRQYQQDWQHIDGVIPATVELIYGHAWMPEQPDKARVNANGEIVIPLSSIRQ